MQTAEGGVCDGCEAGGGGIYWHELETFLTARTCGGQDEALQVKNKTILNIVRQHVCGVLVEYNGLK